MKTAPTVTTKSGRVKADSPAIPAANQLPHAFFGWRCRLFPEPRVGTRTPGICARRENEVFILQAKDGNSSHLVKENRSTRIARPRLNVHGMKSAPFDVAVYHSNIAARGNFRIRHVGTEKNVPPIN